MSKYKFLGKPDRDFPYLKTGKFYNLEIKEVGKEGFWNWYYGITKPIIISPIQCPYDSWENFYQNWKEIK